VNKWIKYLHSGVEGLLLPPVCLLCGAPGSSEPRLRDLCPACRQALPWAAGQCARCALPLHTSAALCGRCQTQPLAFERCLAPFVYQAPLDHLLHGLKFHGRLAQARLLGEVMASWLGEVVDVLPERLIPVPLHASRLRQRGFNQAVELARPIARRFGLSLELDMVRRRRATPPQSELSRQERQKNLKGAFEVLRPLAGRVVIVDDVMTTGSTAHELARSLLNAGAAQVEVWVCARA